ncbi:MAG: valine--tRNA ligase [Bacteroidota bacterium]
MSSPKTYSSKDVEHRWYQHWLDHDYFRSVPDDREPYTICMPPPNVTGVLHMGHMLQYTAQDALMRKARLEGKNACWVPGTDHASIATEAKVVKKLRAKGVKKSDLTREEFLQEAFAWKEEYGGIILEQFKLLGAGADWSRTRFTMEPKLSAQVLKAFVKLYESGQLYRGKRMTNWDPEAQTVLSNEEVVYSDENKNLYHVRYQVEGTEEYIVVATSRPETIMADTGLAVHPDDERYAKYHGKKVIVPLVNRPVPIVADTYVDPEFGTGALKITPAHDPNDYEVGQRHGLEVIDILHADGSLNELAQFFVGEDREEARISAVKKLKETGDLLETKQYRTSVGRSERTDAVVEPRLTLQWFLNMEKLAATALAAVKDGEIKFHPSGMFNMYNSWLRPENVRDWCVSRQLWWGQQIPAWYHEGETFVAETAEEALEKARQKTGNSDLQLADLQQDEDVLDTWFSSALWPMSVFDGMLGDTTELEYYYPSTLMVTGWDIMFFWVARMIMFGYEFSEGELGADFVNKNGKMPFKDVFFTGMVRDEKRRKMTKSLGNSPDAMVLLDRYGADGVRFGMLSSAAAGNDIIFDAPIDPETKKARNESKLCDQGRRFCNKLFNANRLLQGWSQVDRDPTEAEQVAADWLEARLSQTIEQVNNAFTDYRLSDAVMSLYKFIWGDFCSLYLEILKPADGEISKETYGRTIAAFEQMMTLLHPFMPFITEEIWHQLKERAEGDDCVVSTWPTAEAYDTELLSRFEMLQTLVSGVREVRKSRNLPERDALDLYFRRSATSEALLSAPAFSSIASKLAYLNQLDLAEAQPDNSLAFLVKTEAAYLILDESIDVAAEREKMAAELKRLKGFLMGIEKKLGNERFVAGAPEEVVARERKKQADTREKIGQLEMMLG